MDPSRYKTRGASWAKAFLGVQAVFTALMGLYAVFMAGAANVLCDHCVGDRQLFAPLRGNLVVSALSVAWILGWLPSYGLLINCLYLLIYAPLMGTVISQHSMTVPSAIILLMGLGNGVVAVLVKRPK